ncbi:MAG: LysM peptidoglycan-binding domain-containing protein [Chloroflexota bacterium]
MSRRHVRTIAHVIMVIGLLAVLTVLPTFAQDSQTTHVVQRGENLYRIALKYGISVDALTKANDITNASRIFAGQTLIIPDYNPAPDTVENPTVAGTPIKYTVTFGDTLAGIASKYGMTVDELMKINNIDNPNHITRGQELNVWSLTPVDAPAVDAPQITVDAAPTSEPAAVVAAPVVQPPPSATYTVAAGDQLGKIANKFGVSWVDIATANGISDANQIYAGQTLTIPGVSAAVAAANNVPAAPPTPQFVPDPPTIYVGRQVVVDLSDQMVYAYQDGVLVRSLRVSTGLPGSETVLGDYKVYHMLESQRMVGPGYDLPGVPYVMYFYQGYALHGTYWHHNFGHPMSHGCVNMPTPEAEWFYENFVEIGTPVHVEL